MRRRTRNVIWFNPPYSDSLDTNIGRKFLDIVDRSFPPEHKFRQILNRNTLKLSYSCMPNIKTIIAGHNKKTLSPPKQDADVTKPCNCRVKANCPVSGTCQRSAIIYKATVTSPQGKKEYVGLTENTFKSRFYGHTHDMKENDNNKGTTLSRHVGSLKEEKRDFSIKWEIIRQSSPYKCGTRKCDLCLCEKLEIIYNRSKNLLNKRSEMVNKCRHSRKFKLCAVN